METDENRFLPIRLPHTHTHKTHTLKKLLQDIVQEQKIVKEKI